MNEVDPTTERNWGVTGGALVILTVALAVFEVVKGVSAVPVCLVGMGAATCAIAAGRLRGIKQRTAQAGFGVLLVVLIVLLVVVTGSSEPEAIDSPVSPSASSGTPTSSPSSPPTSTATTISQEPAERPKNYVIREGSSQSLFNGALVIGVTFALSESGFAALTLSTRGPECQPNLQPGEKALLADPDRDRWYEVRLAELGATQVTVTVEWGTGRRVSSCE